MSSIFRHFQQQHIDKSQAGLVSIMVTMILMIVLSLIVLGFAQISRRNQRQQLDRQLSTQAFYAAETGVNDVYELIKGASTSASVPEKPNCTGAPAFYAGLNPTIDAAHDVSYSCLTVDPTPTTLQFNGVDNNSVVVPITSATGAPITSIDLNWQTTKATTTPTNNCPVSTDRQFSNTTSWLCGYGVLRVDLVPTTGSLTMAGMQGGTMATFMVPLRTGGTGTMGYVPGGNKLIGASCTNSGCTMSINSGLGANKYYMRISSIYNSANLQISVGGGLELSDAQAIIDSTGKAQDVLRRIQVRLPLGGSGRNALSDYALESTDSICKRFAVMSNGYFSSDPTGVASSPINPLCQ